jgi:hypothetical protein
MVFCALARGYQEINLGIRIGLAGQTIGRYDLWDTAKIKLCLSMVIAWCLFLYYNASGRQARVMDWRTSSPSLVRI